MSAESMPTGEGSTGYLPDGEAMIRNVSVRRLLGRVGQYLLLGSLIFGIVALATLIYTIVDDQMGYVAVEYEIDPDELAGGRALESLSKDELLAILQGNVSAGRFRQLNREKAMTDRSEGEILDLVQTEVVGEKVVASFGMTESLRNGSEIRAEVAEEHPKAEVQWRNWLNWNFLIAPMSSIASDSGIRTAILGSLYLIFFTIIIAIPIGIGGAIYLEEYSVSANPWIARINRLIETNINNLAGVPSIIYGILGLSIFVRALEYYTSGQFVGITDSNGRTIISGALTMALLILPLLIINAREAIRAVPSSLRQASYGLGATKWQTIWNIVLPNALPGILTGTILGVSRAIGETAPLIVVGASTFIVFDPDGPFSKFTVLPIQIYNWTQQPQEEFVRIAAAAIIVLLVMLLALNSAAILLRNYFRRSV